MAKPQTLHRLELVAPSPRSRQKAASPRQVVDVTVRASDRILLTVEDAADRLSISRAQMWRLIGRGEISSLHVGRLRRIEPMALAEYVAKMRVAGEPPAP